jgi:hypothetical protein
MAASIDFSAEVTISMERSSRTYACPECSNTAPDEKVAIFGSETFVNNLELERYPAEVRRSVHENMAAALGYEFLKRGLVSFHEAPGKGLSTAIRSQIGVVSTRRVASIEARAADKMQSFLNGVLDEARARISVWGSHYTGDDGYIEKGMASRFVSEAFSAALKRVRGEAA